MSTQRNRQGDRIKAGDIRIPTVTAQGMTKGVPIRVVKVVGYEFLGRWYSYCHVELLRVHDNAQAPWSVENLAHLSRPHDGQ